MKKLKLFAIVVFMHATSSVAMPMLSADGSSLTGVDVGGALYDIMFGDGIIEDIYEGIVFDAARAEEANAVSAAAIAALNEIGDAGLTGIAGCSSTTFCVLFNPEFAAGEGTLVYVAILLPVFTLGEWVLSAGSAIVQGGDDTSSQSSFTLMTYRKVAAGVPAPATLTLFCLGLAGLGFSHRKHQTHR